MAFEEGQTTSSRTRSAVWRLFRTYVLFYNVREAFDTGNTQQIISLKCKWSVIQSIYVGRLYFFSFLEVRLYFKVKTVLLYQHELFLLYNFLH